MTLSKQLFLTVFITLIGLFGGMSYFTLENTEKFVQKQLAQSAQDIAHTLSFSVAPSLKNDDFSNAKRIIDALFQSGYYQNIKLISSNDVVLVDLINQQDNFDVPDWFIQIVNIIPPVKQAYVMSESIVLGQVFVQCHPGFAYEQAYETMKEGVYLLLLITLLVITLGYGLLYILLSPLREIKKQAKLITKKNFYKIKSIPWASDLRSIVEAMNYLSARLSILFEKQKKIAKHLQEKAYHDGLTGLKNTLWLKHKLYQLKKNKESGQGLYLLLELVNFKSYNDQFGRMTGDQVLIQTARLLETNFKNEANPIIARVEGACFAVILLNKMPEDAQKTAIYISALFGQYTHIALMSSNSIGHAGIALFSYNEKELDINKKVSSALTQAKIEGMNNCVVYQESTQDVVKLRTDAQWKKLLTQSLKDKKIYCDFEVVKMYTHTENEYVECLARLSVAENNILPANEWIYIAQKLQMIHQVDLMIFSSVIEKIKAEPISHKYYFINLSSDTLLQPFYPEDILSRVSAIGYLKENIIIELSEYELIQHLDALKPILEKLSRAGLKLSVDHFGANVNQLHYMQEISIKYIKINAAFTQNIVSHVENQMLIKTFIDIAHSVKAKAIAKHVENNEDMLVLNKIGIDGVMGYIVR